jgi:hypothetical protein
MTFANIFLLLLIFIPLTLLWVFTLHDLSHRPGMSNAATGLWAIAIVLLPLIGTLVYFLALPLDGAHRNPSHAQASVEPLEITDADVIELDKLAKLRDEGILTDEEFSTLKTRVIG